MKRTVLFATLIALAAAAAAAVAQVKGYAPVTKAMLANPSPDDWLMFSRTYDAQRFSPLDQIDTKNVGKLVQAWTRPLPTGMIEIIPIAHNGVLYAQIQGGVLALDGATGGLLWEYKRGGAFKAKTMAIFEDMVIYAASDNNIVALDAATGALRWATSSPGLSSGTVVFEDKVLTGHTCSGGRRESCIIAAHDARTGKELWRFITAAGPDDPVGDASWGGAPEAGRTASTWGGAGSFDPVSRTVYWGVANPTPNTRSARHGGDANATGRTSPADLYSNSTVALDFDTGKLKWYYQYLPGDDWDQDYTNERILVRTKLNPNPKFLKWINPDYPRNQDRDIVLNVGEGGGVFAVDRATGQFIWGTPFPYDGPNFLISNIDGKTGKSTINWDVVLKEPGEQHIICAYNTKSYWPMAYHPRKSSLYIQYADDCLDMTRADAPAAASAEAPAPSGAREFAASGQRGRGGNRSGTRGGNRGGARGGETRTTDPDPAANAQRGAADAGSAPAAAANTGREVRSAVRRPGSDPEKYGGIAKVNVSTGELVRFYEGKVPGNGAMLVTAGNLVFWGDVARKFRAFDADSGKILWEQTLGGPIQNSTITYRANGKQYICVMTGMGGMTSSLFPRSGPVENTDPHYGIHVFALPN